MWLAWDDEAMSAFSGWATERYRPSRGRFRRFVAAAVDSLPDRFRAAQDNVVVVVEPRPNAEDLKRDRSEEGAVSPRLYGIYRGVPLPERGGGYLGPPDVIAVFRRPLLRRNRTHKRLRREIDLTVLHEFGHYFGLDEAAVEHL